MELHLSRRASITVILSETFAPPRITVKGRSGFSVFEPRNSSSFSIRSPATLIGRYAATPAVVAWALWAVPKASLTYASAPVSSASFLENSGSFLVWSG